MSNLSDEKEIKNRRTVCTVCPNGDAQGRQRPVLIRMRGRVRVIPGFKTRSHSREADRGREEDPQVGIATPIHVIACRSSQVQPRPVRRVCLPPELSHTQSWLFSFATDFEGLGRRSAIARIELYSRAICKDALVLRRSAI